VKQKVALKDIKKIRTLLNGKLNEMSRADEVKKYLFRAFV
jgi:hypothetical protein